MALDISHIQMAITIKGSLLKEINKDMGLINFQMVMIIKDNILIINLKVMDNITPKMTIIFQQVIGKMINNKDDISLFLDLGIYLSELIIKENGMESQ